MNNEGSVGLWSSGTIVSPTFMIPSDTRVQTNVSDISALSLLKLLRPITFQYINSNKYDNKKHYGINNLETFFPELVAKNTDIINDIGKLCIYYEDFIYTSESTFILQTVNVSLNIGELIAVYYLRDNTQQSREPVHLTVLSVSGTSIITSANNYQEGDNMFILGRIVNTFKTMNYVELIPLIIKAIQEL
jgi:hypothetical protein